MSSKRELLELLRQTEGDPNQKQIVLDYLKQGPKGSKSKAFIGGVGEGLVDNFTLLPELAARGVRSVAAAAMPALGMSPLPEREGNVIRDYLPSGRQMLAAADVVDSQLRGQPATFDEAMLDRTRMAEEFDGSTALGNAFADALTVFGAAKRPLKEGLIRAGQKPAQAASEGIQSIAKGSAGMKRALARWSQSALAKAAANKAGRSLEAGIEGAAMGVLQDGDPLETAAWSAGTQTAGSIALFLGSNVFKGKNIGDIGLNLAAMVGGTWALLQLTDQLAPGGDNNPISTINDAFGKVIFGLAASTAAGLGGMGRITGKFADDAPIIADAITSLPRGMVLSKVSEIVNAKEEGNDDPEKAMALLVNNANAYTKAQTDNLIKALTEEDVSFVDMVNDMSETDKLFRSILDAPLGLESVPLKKGDRTRRGNPNY